MLPAGLAFVCPDASPAPTAIGPGAVGEELEKAPSRSEALLPARTPTPPLPLLHSKLPRTASDPTPREPPSSPAIHSCPPVILPGKCGCAHFTGEELRVTEAGVSTCRSKWQLHISNSKLLMPHTHSEPPPPLSHLSKWESLPAPKLTCWHPALAPSSLTPHL